MMNDLEDFTGKKKKDLAAQPPVEVFAGFYMYINSKRDTGIKKGLSQNRAGDLVIKDT